jgi:hypothetical protein
VVVFKFPKLALSIDTGCIYCGLIGHSNEIEVNVLRVRHVSKFDNLPQDVSEVLVELGELLQITGKPRVEAHDWLLRCLCFEIE